jgi:hypothetical protein
VSVTEARCAAAICRAKLDHPQFSRIPDAQLFEFAQNRESLKTLEIQLDTRAPRTTTLYFLRPASSPAAE